MPRPEALKTCPSDPIVTFDLSLPVVPPMPFHRLTALCAALLLLALSPAAAQTDAALLRAPSFSVYPSLTGSELLAAVAAGYAPASVFSYDRARDSLFAAVYREPAETDSAGIPRADSLRCMYSGRAIYLDQARDPSTAAYAASPRISTEHIWPQNRGAVDGTPLHSDLHHLAPVQQSINASRGDDPYGEVPDAEAVRWWGPDGTTRTVAPPLAERDLYSEKRNGTASLMEPRESVEGDIARSLFYVWTVYGPNGGPLATTSLDEAFFAAMLPTLLVWNAEDPPDDAERSRSSTIARWQGTENPYVVDASLADRAFGTPTTTVPAVEAQPFALSAPAPNPSSGAVRLMLSVPAPGPVRAVVVDALGREALVVLDGFVSGSVQLRVDAARLAPGVYALRVSGAMPGGFAVQRFTVVR